MRTIAFLSCLLLASSAWADVEGWLITETRVPVYKHDSTVLRMRLITDFRVAGRTHGIQQALFRGGIMLTLAPWFTAATQTTFNAQPTGQAEGGGLLFQQEFRQEFEAIFFGNWGWGRFTHRHRAELRLVNLAFLYRHRIMLRVAFSQPHWRLWPIIFDEFFIDPSRDFVNQNRLGTGVEIALSSVIHIEATYLLKTRSTGTRPAWGLEHDHVARLFLIYSADSFF